GPGTGTRVRDIEGNCIEGRTAAGRQGRRACGSDGKTAELECGVGEAEAEGELRLHIIAFVAPIADEDSFPVVHANGACFRMVIRVGWIILPALFKRGRKMPGGIHNAEQDFRESRTAPLA